MILKKHTGHVLLAAWNPFGSKEVNNLLAEYAEKSEHLLYLDTIMSNCHVRLMSTSPSGFLTQTPANIEDSSTVQSSDFVKKNNWNGKLYLNENTDVLSLSCLKRRAAKQSFAYNRL